MMNFRGIFDCALKGKDHIPTDEVRAVEAEKIRAELKERNIAFPESCPWVGTDAWITRFLDRADSAQREEKPKNEKGETIEHPTALERIITCLKFREEKGINHLLDTQDPEILQLWNEWPLYIHGIDKRGIPVVYEKVALVYPKPFMQRYSNEKALLFAWYSRERIAREIHNINPNISRYIFLESAANIGLRHGHKELFVLLDMIFMNDEKYYPNSCYYYFVVNTPWLFSIFKMLLSPFVNSEALSKICCFSSGDYINHLCKYVDFDQIAKDFLGDCKICDSRCFSNFDEGKLLAETKEEKKVETKKEEEKEMKKEDGVAK